MMASMVEVTMARAREQKERASRWSEAEARSVLGELEQSGQSVSRFAAGRGVGRERLYKWRRRLARATTPAQRAPRFAEVAVVTRPASAAIELAGPGGIILRFGGPSRLDDVRAVLQHLLGR